MKKRAENQLSSASSWPHIGVELRQTAAVGVAVLMQMCLMLSTFAAGDFADTFGALPNSNWRDIPPKVKLITISVQMQDGGLLIPGAGDAARITSVDTFRTGHYSVRFQLRGLGAGNHAYVGFMSREPWGENACMAVLENNRFGLQIRRAGGEVAQPFATPIVTANAWHTLTLDWTADAVEMLYDGQSCGRFTDKTKIPDLFVTSLIDVVQTGGKGFELEVDSVHVKNGEIRRGVRPSALQPPLRTPPDTQTLAWPARRAPELRMDETSATFANAFYTARISWKDGLRLDRLENTVAGLSCLAPKEWSELFTIAGKGKLIRGSDFKVTATQVEQPAGEKTLRIQAEAAGWGVAISVRADSSPELKLNLEVENTGGGDRTAAVFWPHFSGLQVGGNAADNYYLFPWKGGWCQNQPAQLGAVYGQATGFLQLFSVFNPSAGGAVYTYLKDETGVIKSAVLKKIDEPGMDVPSYLPMWPEAKPEPGVMSDMVGTQVALRNLPQAFKAGGRQRFPEVILAVSPGDWRQAFQSYAKWAHSWMKDPEIPTWYKGIFQTLAVHDSGGNVGFEHGWLRNGQWALADQAQPEQQLLEVVYWWNHPRSDGVDAPRSGPIGWYKHTIGDWDHWQELGGLERLRQEIKDAHAKGVRVNLYNTPRFVWKFSAVRKAHPEWLLHTADGKVSDEWSAVADGVHLRYDDMCYACAGWQDYAAEAAAKVVRETGCDGIFMDTMNDARFCYNPAHQHPSSPAASAEAMLKKYRRAIKAANPQAVMTAEDVCAERFIQYMDGCLIKTFDGTQPLYTTHDLYTLHFARFYFPEIKYQEWGSNYADGARRAFFNGVAYMRGELAGCKDPFTGKTLTPQDQLAYLNHTSAIMRENADAFAGLHPEPLVPTKQSKVYANKFPGNKQIVWTLYNRSGKELDDDIIAVPHLAGATYLNLMTGKKILPQVKGETATLRFGMGYGEVVAIAQREMSWTKPTP